MRITGLSTGLDMDEIVKNSMKPYRIKIEKQGQNKEILEIKQKLYRDMLNDSRDLYNKYFDLTSSDSLLLSSNWSSVKFTSSNENLVTVKGQGDAKVDNYTITGTAAKAAKVTLTSGIAEGDKVTINDTDFILVGSTEKERASNLNNELKAAGINVSVRYTDFAGTAGNENDKAINKSGFIIESNILGSSNILTITNKDETNNYLEQISQGSDANFTITNSDGSVYTHTGISNTVTLDGVEFKFYGDILSEGVTINGKQNVTELKDNLVKFFNDYNSVVEKLNKYTMEKRNRDYAPLTTDQKKELSEEEIKLWNSKVEQGQLSRDTDLTRINNSLKQTMRTLVDGTGLYLEQIGISPVKDYSGTKNGTYTIDENKLTKALEENTEEIMNMFIKTAPKDENLSSGEKYAKTGMMHRIKDILYNETIIASSALVKKAGFEGTASAYTNEITLSIQKYEQKMKDMEKDFSRREQLLYTKYANLETVMNKYNSQQSYLMQQLGLG